MFRDRSGRCGSFIRPERRNTKRLTREFSTAGLDGRVTPFIANMAEAFAEADLVIGRAGAGASERDCRGGHGLGAGSVSVCGGRSSAQECGSAGECRRGAYGAGSRDDGRAVVRGSGGAAGVTRGAARDAQRVRQFAQARRSGTGGGRTGRNRRARTRKIPIRIDTCAAKAGTIRVEECFLSPNTCTSLESGASG